MLGTGHSAQALCPGPTGDAGTDGVFNHGSQSMYFNADGYYPTLLGLPEQFSLVQWYRFHHLRIHRLLVGHPHSPASGGGVSPSYVDFIIDGKDSIIAGGVPGFRLATEWRMATELVSGEDPRRHGGDGLTAS